MIAKALTIAGSDSGGGAGIQADLKAFSALGVYGSSVITAVTAQNTQTITAIAAIDPEIVGAQIDAVLDDLNIDAIKIGMSFSAATIRTVANHLNGYDGPIVLDPVMIAKSGDALLEDDAVEALIEFLIPKATIVTPNLPELARLAPSGNDPIEQVEALISNGAKAVLIKGGHAEDKVCIDRLMDDGDDPLVLSAPRLKTRNTHGTGCTLSSAITAELAKGQSLRDATIAAHSYLQAALAQADTLHIGGGHGPVHHFHALWDANVS